MKHILRITGILFLIVILFYIGTVIADKELLSDSVIRLHVVANSNSSEDQEMKLKIRDVVLEFLDSELVGTRNKEDVEDYLASNLDKLQNTVNDALLSYGSTHSAQVHYLVEKFGVREYDTFSLPSGIYDSLRIEIGRAEGKNWWCVIFPTLCLPATTDGFADTAVSAGFNEDLTDALCENEHFELRFFLLDCLGKLENLFLFSE